MGAWIWTVLISVGSGVIAGSLVHSVGGGMLWSVIAGIAGTAFMAAWCVVIIGRRPRRDEETDS